MPGEGDEVQIAQCKRDEEDDEDRLIARLTDREEDEDDASDDEEIHQGSRYWPPPCSNTIEIIASHAGKTVSALTFNHSGTRFAAGGHDHEVRIWDFEAMDSKHPTPINNVQPSGLVVIKHLEFSPNDELILVISGSCQAVIIAKDGTSKNHPTCPKGDQYIQDMTKTKGHVQMLNDGCWSPKDNSDFITSSNDATVRIWDLNKMSQQKTVIKTKSPMNGLKAIPTVCKYSRDALSIIAGCNDGSIMLWDTRRKFLTTSNCIKNAHLKGSEIVGLDFCYANGNKIVSRSEDESCKVWDLRQPKQALATRTDLTVAHSASDCCFSPDDKYVLAGTSLSKSAPGQLLFLDANDLTTCRAIDVEGASVLRARWQPKINHLAYSCTNGQIFMGYDRQRSMGGFVLADEEAAAAAAGARGTKRRRKYMAGAAGAGGFCTATPIKRIITPHALPLFREDQTRGGRAASATTAANSTKRSYKPDLPTSVGQGGCVKPAGSTLSSYIARNLAIQQQQEQRKAAPAAAVDEEHHDETHRADSNAAQPSERAN